MDVELEVSRGSLGYGISTDSGFLGGSITSAGVFIFALHSITVQISQLHQIPSSNLAVTVNESSSVKL